MSKKGENIYKRKDGRWEARYIKSYRPDGTAWFGYCYAKSYREVKQKVMQQRTELAAGILPRTEHHRRRFASYCDEWLQLNRNRVKESTLVKYTAMMEKHVKPQLGGCLVQSLSTVMLEQFSHELLTVHELSPKTVRDILTMLHAVLEYTAKQVGNMPSVEIIYPKARKNEMRVLTREEQERLTGYLLAEHDPCRFGVLLALMTGMRIGEVCALRWENFSPDYSELRVNATMQRLRDLDEQASGKTKIVISDPKSGRSARVIPLAERVASLCRRYANAPRDAFVLTGEKERYMEPRTLQNYLKRYTAACGLQGVHFHTLRHTFATRCVEVDFEIKSLSEILGHASVNITLERYVHSSMQLKRENMNKLAAIGF